MTDFSILEMQQMQQELQERYRGKWEPICTETGQNKLLWMVGEIGEVIDIVKKQGAEKALADPAQRKHLVEELADVLNYCLQMAAKLNLDPVAIVRKKMLVNVLKIS